MHVCNPNQKFMDKSKTVKWSASDNFTKYKKADEPFPV